MRRLIMAAALAAASMSFALAPAFANNNPGVDDLGVDISSVTLTPTGVHSFLSSLAPDARRAVETACVNYTKNGASAGVGEQTLAFCSDALKA